MAQQNVAYIRPEVRAMRRKYDQIRDCLAGAEAVKKARTKYLPQPNKLDTSPANVARYDDYIQRAVFYNVVRRTVFALVGQIFMRAPQVDIPTSLDPLKLDATGENVTLEQLAMQMSLYALAFGRGGLLVDFPVIADHDGDSDITVADLDKGDIRPSIYGYEARDIVNWRHAYRGARTVMTLIVLSDQYVVADDGFETKSSQCYIVLRLLTAADAKLDMAALQKDTTEIDAVILASEADSSKSDVYKMEVWKKDGNNSFVASEHYYPKDKDGNYLNEIPFMFVGAEKNDTLVDHPPVYDMTELNIAHYRNSADYEETSFLTGQPTPYVTGITKEWATDVLKGSIQLGSRATIPLPVGGVAGLLQAAPNTVPFEAMAHKERQMVALGAKLVEQQNVARTATEAEMEGSADTSILATIAKNVSSAVEWACKKCCLFTGDDPNSVTFKLSTEFDLTKMDPAERLELITEWVNDAITTEEMRDNLRRGGVATLDDKEFIATVAKQKADKAAEALKNATDMANAMPQPAPAAGGAPVGKATKKPKKPAAPGGNAQSTNKGSGQ